jgi:hypothetical protein
VALEPSTSRSINGSTKPIHPALKDVAMTLAAPPSENMAPPLPPPRGSKTVGRLIALNAVLIVVVVLTLLTTSALYAYVAGAGGRPPGPQVGDVSLSPTGLSQGTYAILVTSTPPSAIPAGHFTVLLLNWTGTTVYNGPPGSTVEHGGTNFTVRFEDRDHSGTVTAGDGLKVQAPSTPDLGLLSRGHLGLYDELGIERGGLDL